MFVKDAMNKKVFYFEETQKISIADILGLEKIRNIPVVNKNFQLVGLITHRELLNTLAKKTDNVPVKEIMISEVMKIGPDIPLKGAIDIMIANKFGSLPVVDKTGKLIGILTETDLLHILFEMIKLPDEYYPKLKEAQL